MLIIHNISFMFEHFFVWWIFLIVEIYFEIKGSLYICTYPHSKRISHQQVITLQTKPTSELPNIKNQGHKKGQELKINYF